MKATEKKLLQIQNHIQKALDKIRELPFPTQDELGQQYSNSTQGLLILAEMNIKDQIKEEGKK